MVVAVVLYDGGPLMWWVFFASVLVGSEPWPDRIRSHNRSNSR